MARRLLLALATLVALPFLGIPAWIALHRGDLPAPDDAGLMAEVPDVPEKDDAYVWFRKAADAMVWNDSSESYQRLRAIQLRETSEPGWIEDMMLVNARAFLLLEAGLTSPEIVVPPWTLDDPEGPMMEVFAIQTLVKLSAIDARRLAERGETAEAMQRALLGMRVGQKLSQASAPHLVAVMIAAALQGISLAEIEGLLADASLSAGEARDLAARLQGWQLDPDAWRRAWAAEYRFIEDAFSRLGEGDAEAASASWGEDGFAGEILRRLPSDYTFQPNRTLSLAARMYRALGNGSQRTCQETWGTPEPERSDWSPVRIFLSPNSAGRIMLEIARPNFLSFDLRRCHLATRISLVQALLALNAYRSERGALPETLDALVPDYLDAVPEDRFDGAPIRWLREQATLYSVGDDFADDGPPEAPSQTDLSAPALRLPGPPAAS